MVVTPVSFRRRRINRIGWLGLTLLCVGLASAAPRRLRIGVQNQVPPLAFVDEHKQPAGFTVELLREMERVSGVPIEIVPGFWRENIARFQAGELDALTDVIMTRTNAQEFDLSISHVNLHAATYHRADRPALRHTRDFAGKVVATIKGSAANSDAEQKGGWGATIRVFASPQEAFDATLRGECDAILLTNRISFPLIDRRGLELEFVDDLDYRFHLAVHKGDSANLALLNQALALTIADRSFDRIFSKWIGPLEPRPINLTDLRPYYLPVAAGLLALAGIFAWQRHMLRRLARQAEQLRISEERWKFALEGSDTPVWDWDIATGRILYSRPWKELLGLAEGEITGRMEDAEQFIHPEDRAKVLAAREAHWQDPAVPFAIEYRVRSKDGAWKWVFDRGVVVHHAPGGKPLRMIGTWLDLTARKQAEAERLLSGKLGSTGILAGGMAHDFNNLLTVISLNLEMAHLREGLSAELVQHLRNIGVATNAAASLTQQLITFADGGNSLRGPVALPPVLREAARTALRGSGVEAKFDCADDLGQVEGDAAQLGQVFRNLILNAREAMGPGGTVVLQAANVVLGVAQIRSLPAGAYVRVSVSDRGPGIAAEVLPKIFDPYFSTKERGTQRGMGLGLTICHSVVDKHNGALVVDSIAGMGSTFHVYLPVTRR